MHTHVCNDEEKLVIERLVCAILTCTSPSAAKRNDATYLLFQQDAVMARPIPTGHPKRRRLGPRSVRGNEGNTITSSVVIQL